ncbi:MAG: DUF1523 family protein [Gammaproteobacteria bacterium]|nr:DUF1523 family protein [Gammaproteobacteria bacterium]
MNVLKIVKYSLLTALVVVVGMFLHYNLPRTDVVQLTGTDVKRVDRKDPQQGARTRDVRYLNAVTRDGKIRVFRNEDTGWGWPPYLKFNSADLSAKTQSLIQSEEKPWVRIRYYGWRINVFSLFPNAISLKVVDKDYTHIPWFNIIFITLLAVGTVFVVSIFRRLMERLRRSGRYQEISQSVRNRIGRKES